MLGVTQHRADEGAERHNRLVKQHLRSSSLAPSIWKVLLQLGRPPPTVRGQPYPLPGQRLHRDGALVVREGQLGGEESPREGRDHQHLHACMQALTPMT